MILRDQKSRELILWRPECLDLKKLVEVSDCLTPTEKTWALKTKKSRANEYYNLTKCYLFINRLMWGSLFQRYQNKSHGYVNLNGAKLIKLIGDGTELLLVKSILTKLGVIKENKSYSIGRFPKSFKLKKQFVECAPQPLPQPYFISPAKQKLFEMECGERCVIEDDLDQFLFNNLIQLRLDPAIEDKLACHVFDNHDKRDQFYHNYHQVLGYESGNASYARSETNWRVHTAITFMSPRWRNFLRHNEAQLFEVDMCAAQPFMMLSLLPDDDYHHDEKHRWYSFWDDGDFYNAFKKHLSKQIDRAAIKAAFINGGMFAENGHGAPKEVVTEAIEIERFMWASFPKMMRIIKRIKTVRDSSTYPRLNNYKESQKRSGEKIYSQFSHAMQRKEAEVFIDGACGALMDQGVFCYTVHDAIGCHESDIEVVKAAIITATEKIVGFTPILDAKRPL